MRKRLLRSRSGFEKPESREEAIMQNILGASNVLEPSESNIEEILKSILYNTPYTKEAEFEIEKILLAIKNNGTYDGEVESRDMKILLAILNDLDYTEEAESRIEELFIEWLHQRSSIKVLEGVPPLTFPARGLPLINYLIEGNTIQNGTPTPDSPIMPQGTGERTGNLFSSLWEQGSINGTTGENNPSNDMVCTIGYIPIDYGKTYSISRSIARSANNLRFYNAQKQYIGYGSNAYIELIAGNSYTNPMATNISFCCFKIIDSTIAYMRMNDYANDVNTQYMMVEGEYTEQTMPPYEPYGYKIPISSANTTTPVYLGEVETTRKIRKYEFTGNEIWLATTDSVYIEKTNFSGEPALGNTPLYCSHYPNDNTGMIMGSSWWFRCYDTNSIQNWKNYLQQQYAAGTPVCVWYVLSEPTTGIVNEPLMKIGSYTDSISMEQAGIEIPTINGSNTFDVDTTVKPSNVYIEYK